jgi:small subunit ribosomal protein S1
LQEHPWTKAAEQFPTGSTVEGTVSRIADFGAFVRVAAGVEGLIHVSELAHHRVSMVSSVVSEGDQVSVKVLSVDADAQRMSLSLKALQDAPAGTQKGKASQEDDTPAWERTVPQRKEPLKGGMDRPSGGEQFGLKW